MIWPFSLPFCRIRHRSCFRSGHNPPQSRKASHGHTTCCEISASMAAEADSATTLLTRLSVRSDSRNALYQPGSQVLPMQRLPVSMGYLADRRHAPLGCDAWLKRSPKPGRKRRCWRGSGRLPRKRVNCDGSCRRASGHRQRCHAERSWTTSASGEKDGKEACGFSLSTARQWRSCPA